MRIIFLLFLAFLSTGCATIPYVQRPDVQAFVDKMDTQHGFDRAKLCAIFSQTHPDPCIMKMMQKPAEQRPKTMLWYQYRAIFLTPERAQAGARFWRQNAEALAAAEKCYGVPAQIIVAIVGVETQYGKHKGDFKVMNTLTNLAFDYPRRAKFFKNELEQYLLFTGEQHLNPLDLQGSYEGAMGLPQFMPSSCRTYGVDFSGGHHMDLVNNSADAIASIGNYFKTHGWQTGMPVAVRANVTSNNALHFVRKSLKPYWSMSYLASYGITPQKQVGSENLSTLMVFDVESGSQYWMGFKNFYVISRYNSSRYYAMAVYQLSEKILKAKERL